MTTWFALCSLLLVAVLNSCALTLLRRHGWWSIWRREVQMFVLASPLIGLVLSLNGRIRCTGAVCVSGGAPWIVRLGYDLPVLMAILGLGALGLGMFRLLLLTTVVTRRELPAGTELQAVADRLAASLGVKPPRVLLCLADRPLAFTVGLRRPTIVLSSWMVERLDTRELDAVLAHELGHVARHDVLVIWLATILRDAFFYLPTSWQAYRQLQYEKEVVCDDLAIAATRRPLGLASALAKVWQQALQGAPCFTPAQFLAAAGEVLEGRITRLLEMPRSVAADLPSGTRRPLSTSTASVLVSLLLGGAVVALLLILMGCGVMGHTFMRA